MFKKFLPTALFFLITNYLFLFVFTASAQAAVTFSLSPAAKTLNVGDSFTTNIVLDTGGQSVTGATAVLTYDPTKLSIVDASSTQVGTQIGAGTAFINPLSNVVDTVLGKITLDYGSAQATFSGQGTYGTLSFKALANSVGTPVAFVITGGTANSSVYSGGVNVLSAATNGTYVIGTTTTTQTSTASALPQTGGVEDTIFMVVASMIFLSGGLYLFKFSRV